MINFTKEQFLIKDITWMNGIMEQVKEREQKKAKIEAERKARAEQRKLEAEEREKAREERKKKEEERKQREIDAAKQREQDSLQKEVNQLKEITDDINNVASSPFSEQIDLCESLQKYCLKHINKGEPVEEKKEEASD